MYHELQRFGQVKINEPLAKHTTFKIGGAADFFVSIDDTDKLVGLLRFLDGEGTPYFILGGGSNMLAPDDGYRGVVIKIQTISFKITGVDKGRSNLSASQAEIVANSGQAEIMADAGCVTVDMARQSFAAGLSGFEWGVGVPGTIGGAVRGNAGAMGGSMKDIVRSVEVYRDGDVLVLNNAECQFHYRDSLFKHNHDVVLSATLALRIDENKEGMKKALGYLQYRGQTQPQGHASIGCIFKNVEVSKLAAEARQRLREMFLGNEQWERFFSIGKISSGWLVQEAGLKGVEVGQALVSAEHGNFVVNLGGATAAEVRTLVEKIKETVYNKFRVALEEEIQII